MTSAEPPTTGTDDERADVERADATPTASTQPGGAGAPGDDGSGALTAEMVSRDGRTRGESVDEPAKVMRIGAMIKQLLEEVRHAPLDQASRSRLREIYEISVRELAEGLSDDLREELCSLARPFDEEIPSDAELRVAQAQLVGWLEGLFHGIQATLFAQQMAARSQIEQLAQQRGLPPGARPGGPPRPEAAEERPGTYL